MLKAIHDSFVKQMMPRRRKSVPFWQFPGTNRVLRPGNPSGHLWPEPAVTNCSNDGLFPATGGRQAVPETTAQERKAMTKPPGTTNLREKQEMRDQIRKQVEEYLLSGGQIQVCDRPAGRPACRQASAWHGRDELTMMAD
jgi:hypothetical protein